MEPLATHTDGLDFTTAARTVQNIARHFQELKQSAQGFLDVFGARKRGYFTPTEDDEVRHLLIAYWQPRCALLELVSSIHQQMRCARDVEERPVFLAGFAGALVLIDAARFLREHFHDSPVIREKLNEPEPQFGIPSGVYDAVQESLTRPAHFWHVYHAVIYFEQHRSFFEELARRDADAARLLQIIQQLQARLRVRLQDYAEARLRVRSRQVWTGLNRDLLFRAMYGLLKLAGSLASHISVRPGHCPQLPPHIIRQLYSALAPGDVLVTRKEHAITNYFLPGFWPHAALYLGPPDELERRELNARPNFQPRWPKLLQCDDREPRRVLEAMKDGVLLRSLGSPCSADSVAVLRPKLVDQQINEALARAIFHEGKSYDFNFDFTRSDRLVCTEVVYRAYEGVGGITFELTRRAGRLTLSADDLVRKALREDAFTVAAVYLPEKNDSLITRESARAAVAAKCAP